MIIKISNSEELRILDKVYKAACELSFNAFPVGGYVRDNLLGKEVKDIDIVTDGDGILLAQKVAEISGQKGNVSIFSRFGTAMIRMGDYEIEFVGARKESYSSNSRKPEISKGTLADDQLRRDFTINAMAFDLTPENFGKVIDPFNGISDLQKKIIKTPMDPERTFSDDPLRMLRAVRFATQLKFEIDQNTFDGIKMQAHRLDIISQERISSELDKIILSQQPSLGFILLDTLGLLHLILPELTALKGVEICNGIGHKDNFYHTLEVLDNISANTDNLYLRWAAILHDIAKPPTKKFDEKAGWTFHGHEVLGAKMVYTIFKRLKMPLDSKMKYVQKLVRLHLRPISLTKNEITESAVRRLLYDGGEDIDDLMILAEADITSKNENKVNRYLTNYQRVRKLLQEVEDKDKLRIWQPPVDGEMIMKIFNLSPGKEVGILKNAIREAILDGELKNDKSAALNFLIDQGKKMSLSIDSDVIESLRD